jgi:hypothetical protein
MNGAQLAQPWRDRQGVVPAQPQFAVADHQVLPQVAVARGQLVHEPALLQPGEGAAVRGRLAQLLFAQLLVEGADGRLAVGVEQDVHGGQQRVDAGPGAPT